MTGDKEKKELGLTMTVRNRDWREFIEGEIYEDTKAPWYDDAGFTLIRELPGLRDSVGGRVASALTQAIGLVQALAQVDLSAQVRASTPAQGLCLGFGMNALEPYDLLQVFKLDCVHAYEWIGEQVIEAAQTLHALRTENPLLPAQIRLHHGTISNLSALTDASIRIVYTANVFNREVPMTPQTLTDAFGEILRVLARGGIVVSRGSSGVLEEKLAQSGRLLLQTPLVSVLQKE